MRFFVMLLSMATVVLYGYALAGLGGYIWGNGRMDYILWGLIGGTISALVALYFWKKHPEAFFTDAGSPDKSDKKD